MRTTRKFWGVLAMVGMLFASSCSQNELLDNSSDSGNYVSATFTLNSPESGIASRADIGKGTKVNKVVCATFDAYGTELEDLRQHLSLNDEKQAQYSIRLVKGQDYRVAFFAYYAQEGNYPKYYDITDLKNIVIINQETKLETSNLEDRDAFTAYEEITAAETMNPIEKPVTLYRPFAQLNLGSNKADWDAAVAAGVEVAKTKVVVKDVYTAFNAFEDAVVGDPSEVTFDFNAIPEELLEADGKGGFEDGAYKYLSLNYLLVGDKDNEKDLLSVEFIWQNADASKTNNPTTTFTNIPVQRNYRTNIIGWLLTNPAQFNITIDARFAEPDKNEIYDSNGNRIENEGTEGGDDNNTGGDDDNNNTGGGDTDEETIIPDVVKLSDLITNGLTKVYVGNTECYLIENCTYKTLIIDANEAILLNNVDVATLQYNVTVGNYPNNTRNRIYLKDVDFSNNPTGFNFQGWSSQFVYIDNCKVNGQPINNSNKSTVFGLSNSYFNDQTSRVGFSEINVQ